MEAPMPWKIIEAAYDATDPATLHDDELIAIERALSESIGQPLNETNPRWRAREKVRRLAKRCTGQGDPIELLPPEARASPVWKTYVDDKPKHDAPPARAAKKKRRP
jgi:hypothetical protein